VAGKLKQSDIEFIAVRGRVSFAVAVRAEGDAGPWTVAFLYTEDVVNI
jgi:hypothetical protein